jgi:hypothetical protein
MPELGSLEPPSPSHGRYTPSKVVGSKHNAVSIVESVERTLDDASGKPLNSNVKDVWLLGIMVILGSLRSRTGPGLASLGPLQFLRLDVRLGLLYFHQRLRTPNNL